MLSVCGEAHSRGLKGKQDSVGHLPVYFCPHPPPSHSSRSGLVLVTACHSKWYLGTLRKGPSHVLPPNAFPVVSLIRLRTQRWKVNCPLCVLGHPKRVSVWKWSSTLWCSVNTHWRWENPACPQPLLCFHLQPRFEGSHLCVVQSLHSASTMQDEVQ